MPTPVSSAASRGSTLIEVLIATTFVVFVLLALASSFTLVLRNQRNSANQQQATKYAQEALEWVRQVRDVAGWQSFYDVAHNDPSVHCLQTIPAVSTAAYTAMQDTDCTAGVQYITNEQTKNQYFRKITVTEPAADKFQVVARVSWIDGTQTYDSQQTLILRKWSR